MGEIVNVILEILDVSLEIVVIYLNEIEKFRYQFLLQVYNKYLKIINLTRL